MGNAIDYTREVRYEYMHGRAASEAIKTSRLGYLPIGCLERHGDHLPMGLDVIKAQGVCTILAQTIGGVVFPPHHYSGVHGLSPERTARFTGEWGNIYTDHTSVDHLIDVATQFEAAGIEILVLYSGHYPSIQIDMIEEVKGHFVEREGLSVIPFCESMILDGDHAGVSETSFMLYLDRSLVDMTSIGEENYEDHGWGGGRDPKNATSKLGEESIDLVISHLRTEIDKVRTRNE
jgi:creatinine amidohydrolase